LLSCKDASRLQSQAQDRPLKLAERIGLRLHLLICDNCRRFTRQLRVIRAACGRVDESGGMGADAKGLTPEARARILKELASGQGERHD